MAFLKKNGGSTTLVRKVKVGGRWRNEKIANLCGFHTVDEALMLIPERVKALIFDIEEFREATENDLQTGWHRRVVEQHEMEIKRLETEHRALRNYVDGIETGTFSNGGGI